MKIFVVPYFTSSENPCSSIKTLQPSFSGPPRKLGQVYFDIILYLMDSKKILMIQSEKQQIYSAQIYKLKINNMKNRMFYQAVFILEYSNLGFYRSNTTFNKMFKIYKYFLIFILKRWVCL